MRVVPFRATIMRVGVGLCLGSLPALAQEGAGRHLALGDSAHAALDVPAALAHYEAAVAEAPRSYEALCKAARDAVDLGDETTDAKTRAALYKKAGEYARRAVEVNPQDAEGHFHQARALGVAALTMGVRDRVKYATEVRAAGLRALALDPRHPGALHVLGVWNAEVMRLNGFERTIARTFLGGRVFGSASWADAVSHMEAAVAADPDRLTHHLDLARIYRDIGEKAKAREQYETVIRGAPTEYGDARRKREAAKELATIR
jgi:tetratricopeptide (TPR) repeat protein